MATFRVTFSFQCGLYGWTEQFYADGVAVPTKTLLTPIVNARRYMLSEACILKQITYVDTQDARRSYPFVFNLTGDAAPTGEAEVAVPSIAVQIRITGQDGANRTLWLRGIPTSWVSYNGPNQVLTGPTDLQLSNWLSAAQELGYAIRYIDQTVNPWRDLMRVSQLTDGRLTMEVDGQTWPNGAYFRLRNVDFCAYPQLDGPIRVVSRADDVITTNKIGSEDQHFPLIDNNAQARLVSYLYDGFSQAEKVKARNRDTGRPIDLPRGRQSSRKCPR